MKNSVLTPFLGGGGTLQFDLQKFATYEVSSFDQFRDFYVNDTLKDGDTVKLIANITVPDPQKNIDTSIDEDGNEYEEESWYEQHIIITGVSNLTLDLNGYSVTGKNSEYAELLDIRDSVLTIISK